MEEKKIDVLCSAEPAYYPKDFMLFMYKKSLDNPRLTLLWLRVRAKLWRLRRKCGL